jgi:undecaprenyldiphospho-muramoylpentapeptide beta-N-acetylglucosaminyltransferase
VVESVLLAGGGTAGHVNPLLAVADELTRRDAATRITVLGTAEGLEAELVPARGYQMVTVPRVPLPRRPTLDWFRLPSRLRRAGRIAAGAIRDSGAQVVVGFGGYVSVPAYRAARRLGVPVVIHEQNARPGLANRWGARHAAAVAVTFPGTRLPHATVTGLPLRPQIADLVAARGTDPGAARRVGAAALGLDPDRTTLLVTGGSLGALRLNTTIADCARDLVAAGVQVLHLTGAGKDTAVRAAVAGLDTYHVLGYLAEMEHALALADVVLARAGAGTVAELTALGLPAVYVPLPIGNGEQRLNAMPVVAAGGGLVVPDADFTPAWVRANLLELLADPARRRAMALAAAAVGVHDGAARVADLIEAVA